VRDFARLSKYPRKRWDFETVPGQLEGYTVPADWIQQVSVRIDGTVIEGTDPLTIADIAAGYVLSSAPGGYWYLAEDQQSLGIYPISTEVRQVATQYVYTPPALVLDTDTPSAFPESFHSALLLYVAAQYYSTVEDNPELAQVNDERYRAKAAELEQFRISQETADATFHIQIAGMTA
jgi:hypothetical protein